MTHRFMTTLLLSVAGGQEQELAIIVEYARTKASAATLMDPGESASVSIERILAETPVGMVPAGWLEDVLRNDDELLADVMQHWSDEDDAARDRRDEDRMQDIRDGLHE